MVHFHCVDQHVYLLKKISLYFFFNANKGDFHRNIFGNKFLFYMKRAYRLNPKYQVHLEFNPGVHMFKCVALFAISMAKIMMEPSMLLEFVAGLIFLLILTFL